MATTELIVYRKALLKSCGEECVEWANQLLESGENSADLRMLAGMCEPYNHFEIAELRDRILTDLGLGSVTREKAIKMYTTRILRAYIAGQLSVPDSLSLLRELYLETRESPLLLDFYRLHHAYLEISKGFSQDDWPGATAENFNTIYWSRALRLIKDESLKK